MQDLAGLKGGHLVRSDSKKIDISSTYVEYDGPEWRLAHGRQAPMRLA
jgi:hypothetical protein